MHALLVLLFFSFSTYGDGGGAMDPNGAASDRGPGMDPWG